MHNFCERNVFKVKKSSTIAQVCTCCASICPVNDHCTDMLCIGIVWFFSRYLIGLYLVTEIPSGQERELSRLATEDAVKLSENSQQLISTHKLFSSVLTLNPLMTLSSQKLLSSWSIISFYESFIEISLTLLRLQQ